MPFGTSTGVTTFLATRSWFIANLTARSRLCRAMVSVGVESLPVSPAKASRTSLDVSSVNGRCPIRSITGPAADR